MNFLINPKALLLAISLTTAVSAAPTSASAAGRLHIDLPGISIGVNDRNSHYDNRRSERRNYNRNYYNNSRNYYNNNRNYNNRSYRPSSRSYNSSNYYNVPRRQVYQTNNQSNYCPTAGYSEHYYNGHNCYQHKGHYHCN